MSTFIQTCKEDIEGIRADFARGRARSLDRPSPAAAALAVSGASCAGKTTLCGILAHDERVVIVAERYTELFGRGRLLTCPADATREERDWCWIRNQFLIAVEQIGAEEAALSDPVNVGKLVVADRSLADAAIYMPGGLPQLLELIEMSEPAVFGRYRAIIQLAKPSEDVYLRVHDRNTARYPPDYALVIRREEISLEICGKHPAFRFIEDAPWLDKLRATLDAIAQYLP